MIIILAFCSLLVLIWLAMVVTHILYNKYDKMADKYMCEEDQIEYSLLKETDENKREELLRRKDEVYDLKHKYRNKHSKLDDRDIFTDGLSIPVSIVFLFVLMLVIILPAICIQATADKYEVEMNMQRDALIADYQAYKNSTTYDTTTINERIANFNIELHNAKYWADNPWTSWYNPQTVKNIEYIDTNALK